MKLSPIGLTKDARGKHKLGLTRLSGGQIPVSFEGRQGRVAFTSWRMACLQRCFIRIRVT